MKKYVCLFKLWERVGFLITCVTLLILGTGRNCSAQSYYYDELNRLEKIVYDDGSYITYSYDANGNIKNNVVENNEQDQEDTSKDKQDNPASENPQVIPDNNIENDPNDLKTDLGENNTENSSSDLESEKEKSIVGKKIKSKNATYEITSAGKIRTVALIKLNHKRYKNFVISDSIKYKGKSYKITKIADNALKKQTKLQSVTIGNNVTVIGKNAFYGDKNLKRITVKTTRLKVIGKNALKGINKNAIIKVPKKKYTKYKKLFKGKGQKKTVKINKI